MLEVRFHHGSLVSTPLNEGELPLIVLDLSAVTDAKFSEVSSLQKGTPPGSFEFPEQAVALAGSAAEISSLAGEFSLEFNGAATPLVPANVSAVALTAALMRLDTVGEIEVFRTDTSTSREWKVRFYATGDPAHTGPQPTLNVNASTLSSGSRRTAWSKLPSYHPLASAAARPLCLLRPSWQRPSSPPCASSARTSWPRAAPHSQSEPQPVGS